MNFIVKSFYELTHEELYDLLKLRSEVFVVEQNCAYQDLDDYDKKSLHILGMLNDEVLAYTRILEAGLYYKEAAIGRVVTSKKIRMDGYGKAIMQYSMEYIRQNYNTNIRIMAQCYLNKFYTDLGFKTVSDEFLEDGIPHVEMVLTL